MTAEEDDTYPFISEQILESGIWFRCTLCGGAAMHFISREVILCDYCYAAEEK